MTKFKTGDRVVATKDGGVSLSGQPYFRAGDKGTVTDAWGDCPGVWVRFDLSSPGIYRDGWWRVAPEAVKSIPE